MSYLIFEERELETRKTKLWNVRAKDQTYLGSIKWWSGWRRYTFFPAHGATFDAACLREIADKAEMETKKRKAR